MRYVCGAEFNRQAKDRLAHDTRIAKQTEEVLVDTRFRAGEYLRRQQELVREEKTKELEFSHETDYAYQTEMFKRDEKSRATHKEARAIKAKSRLDEGRLRQKMIENERKATEKAAKEKALENKRAFHELQRLKAVRWLRRPQSRESCRSPHPPYVRGRACDDDVRLLV